jgi:hypothetical protein
MAMLGGYTGSSSSNSKRSSKLKRRRPVITPVQELFLVYQPRSINFVRETGVRGSPSFKLCTITLVSLIVSRLR